MTFRNWTQFKLSPLVLAFVNTQCNVYIVAYAASIFRVPFIPKEGGSRFLLNVGNHLQDYTVSQPRSSHPSPWKPQISSDVWLYHHDSIYGTSFVAAECTTLSLGRLHISIPPVTLRVWAACARFIEPQGIVFFLGYMHYTRVREAAAPSRRNAAAYQGCVTVSKWTFWMSMQILFQSPIQILLHAVVSKLSL
jgi:hypothetical protein